MSDEMAFVNHERLRELCQNLRTFATTASDLIEDLDNGLSRLGNTFQDETFQEFQSAYRGARVRIVEFVEETRSYWPVLQQDADDLANAHHERPE